MKLVLDTNVFIAGFITPSACHHLVQYVMWHHNVIASEKIVQEVERTLRRKLHFSDAESNAWAELISAQCTMIGKLAPFDRQISRDKNDDHILALALQEDVDLIITGDKDLLVLKKYRGAPIVQPKDALKVLME